jgi:DNA-nicking Smr family endonuclease
MIMKERQQDLEKPEYSQIDFGHECDLHFFDPSETASVVNEFIRQAVSKGLSHIRLIHGKGRSVKRREVYEIVSKHPDVVYFGKDGPNWGAILIKVKLG